MRKVVLTTNIAETAITVEDAAILTLPRPLSLPLPITPTQVDDVAYVIDTGRMKVGSGRASGRV